MVVVTKADKLKPMKRKNQIGMLKKSITAPTHAVVPTSSQSGDGIDLLWKQIHAMI
jgi:GTP-binding protein EngB required for normal cell division